MRFTLRQQREALILRQDWPMRGRLITISLSAFAVIVLIGAGRFLQSFPNPSQQQMGRMVLCGIAFPALFVSFAIIAPQIVTRVSATGVKQLRTHPWWRRASIPWCDVHRVRWTNATVALRSGKRNIWLNLSQLPSDSRELLRTMVVDRLSERFLFDDSDGAESQQGRNRRSLGTVGWALIAAHGVAIPVAATSPLAIKLAMMTPLTVMLSAYIVWGAIDSHKRIWKYPRA